jgi:purine nucleosidase
MKYKFDVPEQKKIRLIINTDAKNEADDQYAIAHALLTPRFKVKGIIAAHFGTFRTNFSMQESYDEVVKILDLMDLKDKVDLFRGAERAMKDETSPVMSEGAEFIIKEAMSDDPTPLYAIFLGPLTDLAAAYLHEPRIAEKMTVIWIGGGPWPLGGGEFNLSNDIPAANVVFKSDIPLWQVTVEMYSKMKVGLAELEYKVRPYGEIGEYLFQQLVDYNDQLGHLKEWPPGESWVICDIAATGLLLDEHGFSYKMESAPSITPEMKYVHEHTNRPIRVYHDLDSRFILEDFFCKLAISYPAAPKEKGV